MIEKLIIGAPFGNYLHFAYTTPTLGTYTSYYRGGFWKRVWRVLTTVRYYPGIQAWKNKLGLPNPSIRRLTELCGPPAHSHIRATTPPKLIVKDKIVSVTGHNDVQWETVIVTAADAKPAMIEMNVGCPNCPGDDATQDYPKVFAWASEYCFRKQVPLCLKLPPVSFMRIVRQAVDGGICRFHCCNTLPTPGGGMSGKPLKPLALQASEYVRNYCYARSYALDMLIGGGGVTHAQDAQDFLGVGCTNVAVASVLFNPLNWPRVRRIAHDLYLRDAPPPQPAPAVKDVEQLL